MKAIIRCIALGLGAGLVSVSALVCAQPASTYPTKPVKIYVTFPPGGQTDIIARFLSDGLTKAWDKQVLVEYKTGAGGTIGQDYVAKQPGDGYSLVIGSTGPVSIAQSVYPKLPYDSLRDFTYITGLTRTGSAIGVHPSIPAKNLKEFVEYVRARPGKVPFASPGTGVTSHLAMENLALSQGLQMIHVPYKGSAPALNALVAGEVAATFDPIATLLPHVKSGRVRAIAMSGEKRSPLLPEVQTTTEAGFKGIESFVWNCLMAPAGTPAEVVAKIHRDATVVLKNQELRDRLGAMGTEILEMGPAEMTAYVKSETEKWGGIARRVGAKVE